MGRGQKRWRNRYTGGRNGSISVRFWPEMMNALRDECLTMSPKKTRRKTYATD